MNHLISQADLGRIESQLLLRRDQLVQATSWTFNLVFLVLILGSFVAFLYVQYNSHTQEVQETKRIPFTPVTWYSATRNVRSEEYGRPIAIEAGYGLSGSSLGGGSEEVY
jgi:hypothetical protein